MGMNLYNFKKIETLESVNEAEQPITVEDSEFEKNSGESLHEYEMIEPDATTEEQIPTEEMHEEEILVAIENGEQNESIPVEIMTEEVFTKIFHSLKIIY